MPRLMITIPKQTADALTRVAFAERRDPRDQAALYVERALEQNVGRLAPSQKQVRDAQPA